MWLIWFSPVLKTTVKTVKHNYINIYNSKILANKRNFTGIQGRTALVIKLIRLHSTYTNTVEINATTFSYFAFSYITSSP